MKKILLIVLSFAYMITLFGCDSIHDYETDQFIIHQFNYSYEITGYKDGYFDENLIISYDVVAFETGSSNEVHLVLNGISQNAFQNLDLLSISFDYYTRSEYWEISSYAFADNGNLTNVDFNGLLFYLDDFVFANDSNLESIDISNVRSIGDSAFKDCAKLEEVHIGTAILTIGNNTFENCADNISIYINSSIPPTIGSDVFQGVENYKIYVPSDNLDDYINAEGWEVYSTHIFAL
ncbi:MAG: leucine-rich repeat domain-containing protein [bacterium]